MSNAVDNVNHPKHYEGHTSLECIQVMELIFGFEVVVSFCLCNAFKYMWRYKNKNGEEDLHKTEWYLNYARNKLLEKKFIGSHSGMILGRLEDLYSKIVIK